MWGLPYTKNFWTRYHQKTWTSFKTESEPFYKIKGSNINLRQDTRLQFLSRKLVHRRVVGRAELNDFEPFELEPLALLAKEFIILSFFFFESFTWQSYVRATKIFLFFHCDYWCSNELRLPGWGQLPRRWDQLVTLESGPSQPQSVHRSPWDRPDAVQSLSQPSFLTSESAAHPPALSQVTSSSNDPTLRVNVAAKNDFCK